VSSPPMGRVDGGLIQIDDRVVSDADLDVVLGIVTERTPAKRELFLATGELDSAYIADTIGRFRVNGFRQRGSISFAFRYVPRVVPSFKKLGLPPGVERLAEEQRGLILVTGATGSGKSTTLAAIVDHINRTRKQHIVTIEDPIEIVHDDWGCIVNQREIGLDTESYDQALRRVLRQDPDVILIGELRDVETLRMALRAADTGHQVFSTVHSVNAPLTVERIVAMFPPAEHKLLLSQLSHSLEAIISQRLLPAVDGKTRLPIVEILRGGPVTEKFILEGRLNDISEYIENGERGMQSFDQQLLALFNQDKIAGREALAWASNPEVFAMAMRGIRKVGAGRQE